LPGPAPVLLCRQGYLLAYDPQHKIARWTAYHLTREKVEARVVRRQDSFREDADVPAQQRSTLRDYRRSGFDRGHMVPAAAMRWSERAMSESFLLTNMAPQVGIGFNRHIWKELEALVRTWAAARQEVYVVTGAIVEPGAATIGEGKVTIPSHFYKVIFDPVRVDVIAFLLPNRKLDTRDLPNYRLSVDELEQRTQLDFLSELPDEIEDRIESIAAVMW